MSGFAPDPNDFGPREIQSAPDVNEFGLRVDQAAPHMNEPTPHMNEPAPHVNYPASHVSEFAQQVNESAADVNDSAPYANDLGPHVNEFAPHVSGFAPEERELFVRHAKLEGRSVARLRALDRGESCVVEAEVFPRGATAPTHAGPYTFADVGQATAFVTEAMESLLYLGCEVFAQ